MKKKLIFFIILFLLLFNCKISAYTSLYNEHTFLFYNTFKTVTYNDVISTADDNYFSFSGDSFNNDYTTRNQITANNGENTSIIKNYYFSYRNSSFEITYMNLFSENIKEEITSISFENYDLIYNLEEDMYFANTDFSNMQYYVEYTIWTDSGPLYISDSGDTETFNIIENVANNLENPEILEKSTILFNYIYIEFTGLNNNKKLLLHRNTLTPEDQYESIQVKWAQEWELITVEEVVVDYDFTKFIVQIFKTFDSFLAIKFGTVSLGSILLIPLVLSIVFVILRIWRGGSA